MNEHARGECGHIVLLGSGKVSIVGEHHYRRGHQQENNADNKGLYQNLEHFKLAKLAESTNLYNQQKINQGTATL